MHISTIIVVLLITYDGDIPLWRSYKLCTCLNIYYKYILQLGQCLWINNLFYLNIYKIYIYNDTWFYITVCLQIKPDLVILGSN